MNCRSGGSQLGEQSWDSQDISYALEVTSQFGQASSPLTPPKPLSRKRALPKMHSFWVAKGGSTISRRRSIISGWYVHRAWAYMNAASSKWRLVQIAEKVELQQVRRIVRWSPRAFRLRLGNNQLGDIDPINPEIDDAD